MFGAIPPAWAELPDFLELYGSGQLRETTYTVFLRRSAVESSQKMMLSHDLSLNAQSYGLHYFGHALVKSNEKGDREPRGVKLSPLDSCYKEALGTVFVAATHKLGLRSASAELLIDGVKIDPAYAIEKLRHHGFRLLCLDEFMTF